MTAYQVFLSKLTKGLSEYYGKAYRVEVIRTRKNNGVEYQGIAIMPPGSDVSPAIYMERMFRDYREGEPLSEIMGKVIRIYDRYRTDENFDMDLFRDFGRVRDRIVYRLIGYETNRPFLSGMPHEHFLDMVVVFYLSFFHDTLGCMSIPVTNDICRLWGTDGRELAALAEDNTPRLLPASITDIRQILEKTDGVAYMEGEEAYMYLLTNGNRQYGAACLRYPRVLAEFSGRIGKSFYILPSSVHETLLVPEQPGMDGRALGDMVWEINRTQVEPEEVLTDSVYFYDRKKEKILILDISDRL